MAFGSRADLPGILEAQIGPDVFTADGTVPTPIGLRPGTLARGASQVSVNIAGGFFLSTSVVEGDAGVTIESPQFQPDGSIDVVLSIAPDAAVADHTIKVRNPGTIGNIPGPCTDCLAVI